jgi:hypothetical protein
VKTSTASAAMAGRTSGKTIVQKIRSSLAPASRAASTSSTGRRLTTLRMKSVQNPV